MTMSKFWTGYAFLLKIHRMVTALLFGCLLANAAHAGQVAVSNYPLYLLSQAVTQGQQDAVLLLKAGDVGHHGSLSPSSLKQVQDSQFVVWFGEELEQNLAGSLTQAPNAIGLFKFNTFIRHPLRQMDGTPKPNSFDPHIWLNPTNAKAIVAALSVIHGHANPDLKSVYQANAQAFFKKMDAASALYRHQAPTPYWAYHDAYQYLEAPLKLTLAGTLTPDHHLSPKASRFRVLNETRPSPVMCLASQIPVSDGIQQKLGNVQTLVRQEDMSDGTDFIDAWTELADSLIKCTQAQTA